MVFVVMHNNLMKGRNAPITEAMLATVLPERGSSAIPPSLLLHPCCRAAPRAMLQHPDNRATRSSHVGGLRSGWRAGTEREREF